MNFTYGSYEELIKLLKKNNYSFCKYGQEKNDKKVVILRHDIDNDISKALKFAQIEKSNDVLSTYFVLLSTNFYNVFSESNIKKIKKIKDLGHEIGLHFDETKYVFDEANKIEDKIKYESKILEKMLDISIKVVSMHRPSKETLNKNIKIEGIINSYSEEYFKEFKYISDSRMQWKEDVENIIISKKYNKLHILTHAFWYEKEELNQKDVILKYFEEKKKDIYKDFKENISDFEDILCFKNIK